MTEAALAARVVEWLEAQHWDVYQEVPYGDRADIVAVRAGLVWIIETKTSLSLHVMSQAARWNVHLRSIAVPWGKRGHSDERRLAERICRDVLQVGVLYIDDRDPTYYAIRESVPAPLCRQYHESAKRIQAKLSPEHKTHAKAGTNGGGVWTPYRETMEAIKRFLQRQGEEGASLRQIMEEVGNAHYANAASAKACIPGALEKIEAAWCEVVGEGREQRYRMRVKIAVNEDQ